MSLRFVLAALAALLTAAPCVRARARAQRRHVRLLVEPYRADRGHGEGLVAALETIHKLLSQRWWRRLAGAQESFALELHVGFERAAGARAALAIVVPAQTAALTEAALRGAYPNAVARRPSAAPAGDARLLRLRKRRPFIERLAVIGPETLEDPPVDRLLTVMAAAVAPATAQSPGPRAAFVQIALTPAPVWFERLARRLHEHRERSRARDPQRPSQVAQVELAGGLELQHRPLFFGDIRVGAPDLVTCRQIAAELRAGGGENRLVERAAALRRVTVRSDRRRIAAGEAGAVPGLWRGVYAANELAVLWHLPSVGFTRVPCARRALPVAPAPPAILRPSADAGLLRDEVGPVTIHPELRRQNTAVVGTVEQGKTSLLVSSIRADLERPRCAVIVLDPKGDAADAAVGAVPEGRACTLLDLGRPTCGFNPLAVDAPPDTIADFVVAALRQLFGDGDIRASSDRYLRNAIIAVLACDAHASLWDVARLLSVGDEGRAYRERVGRRLLELPQYSEVAAFFAAELGVQLADARAATTAKLDAPSNKLARVLNSVSIKRILRNQSLPLDLDAIIAGGEVLVVKGALGEIGTSNVAVLMQLIVGALDAALARQQDRRNHTERVAVALKIDEAPLVINEGFAQTLALKRSAGLETVACWQTDSQWAPELRAQLDALFAHRVYFATASAQDAREGAGAMMDAYSDQLRADDPSGLAAPDVRLHLPRHFAIASWVTPEGRQRPFIGETLPFEVDEQRLAWHAAAQYQRGGRELVDFRQPHWESQAAVESRSGSPRPAVGHEPARPSTATPASFGELLALDAAVRGRIVPAPPNPRPLYPDDRDLELMAWLGTVGWALTTQIHRRFEPGKALTTTQRRLKRLADAGVVVRVQLHAADGGGAPMGCALAGSGRELLGERKLPPAIGIPGGDQTIEGALEAIRERVHLVGWLLALEARVGGSLLALRGPRRLRLAPPSRGGRPIGPADLELSPGRTPRDFLRRQRGAPPAPPEAFAAVTPLAAAELQTNDGRRAELLVDAAGGSDEELVAALERYDHMLAGWWSQTHAGEPPRVLFVCPDAARAAAAARLADATLTASQAYPGEDPREWPRPGRERIFLVAERDLHEGRLEGLRVPALPPSLRAGEDAAPHAAEFISADTPAGAPARAPWA